MTMVPSESGKQKRSTSDYVFYSAMNQVGYNCLGSEFLVTRHNMAQPQQQIDSSTPTNITNTNSNNQREQSEAEPEPEPELEPEAGSTSKEEEIEEGANNNNSNNNNNNWLQLSIGFNNQSHTTTRSNNNNNHNRTGSASGSGLVELELLPQRHSNWASSSSSRPMSLEAPAVIFPARGSSLVFEQTTSSCCSSSMAPSGPTFGHQEMMNWAFGPLLPHSMPFTTSSLSSSSIISQSLRPPLAISNYNYPPILPPFHHHHFPSSSSSSGFDQFDVAGMSSDVTVRVVDPPRRPHSGIWFMLQASQNQGKEPFLPQIPKNYLRIKDGRMTVRLLLKYLVSKLKLESESEIEITCRGQQLLPFLTLQHVRDNIWTPRDITTRTLLSDSSTTDHVMVLHYGRSTS